MTESESAKRYDLEDRTLAFAKKVREFVRMLGKTPANTEDVRQLIRASGSVGANYIEANEALSKKDVVMRIKICRKEAKEARYWLRLVDTQGKAEHDRLREQLIQEAAELTHIFGSIVTKSQWGLRDSGILISRLSSA